MVPQLLPLALLSCLSRLSSTAPQYPAPAPAEAYPDLPPVYNYQYGVNDQGYSESVFSHSENRDGPATGGEYRVNLPDGRVQIVTYTAGPEGYNAAVTYEGEAQYPPEAAPAPYNAAPAPYVPAPAPYKPAPAPYKPAPAPYKAAPAPHVPAPAPIAPAYAPAPVAKVIPVVVAPVVPAYAPAPVVQTYAPIPVVKAYAPAPIVQAYAPAPVVPAYSNPGYSAYPQSAAYSPKKYGYTVVAEEAAPAQEPRQALALEVEEAVFEEPAAPAEVAEAAAAEAEAVEKVEELAEEAVISEAESRYRYRF